MASIGMLCAHVASVHQCSACIDWLWSTVKASFGAAKGMQHKASNPSGCGAEICNSHDVLLQAAGDASGGAAEKRQKVDS